MMPRGVLLSSQLGLGNKGRRLILHQPPRRSWWEKLTGNHNGGYGFELDPRDQAGCQALNELAGRALNDVANTVTQSADHVKGFFERLRTELGFYLGCVNLHIRLTTSGVPICFPTATPIVPAEFRCRDLRDVGLCLTTRNTVTGNDIDADGKSLIVVTGANEGGKSTFLRSVGTAQTMMQAGMFVTAESFQANVAQGIFTHFKREEDATMTRGKLDEELARMSDIADYIGLKSLLLCNESFASTNEREGSQIARGVIDAFTEAGIKVVYVTHLYDLAHSLHNRHDRNHLFLRAERRDDGVRTFRLMPAEPEPTSYGADSFRRIFGPPVGVDAGGR
jgi:DNA mismatch repair ATPase MutS